MNEARIVCTAIPTGFAVDAAEIPVSVLVAPRLVGDDVLGAYPDWVNWPQHCLDRGVSITFECAGQTRTVQADTSALRPDIWNALFTEQTYVRSHEFDDHSGEFISSYDNRLALGLIQATYQTVGIEFAVPVGDDDPREQRNRYRFANAVRDFALQWDDATGRRWRAGQAGVQGDGNPADLLRGSATTQQLTADGLIATGELDRSDPAYRASIADTVQAWGVFDHQPQGDDVTRETLDANRIDFHQALSAVHAYRSLQRQLGLVFDITLPAEFFADTGAHGFERLNLTGFDAGWSPDITTTIPPTSTGYVYSSVEQQRLFAVAPLSVVRKQPFRPRLFGLLDLDPRWFGVAQVDIDGAMHKTVMQADNLTQLPGEAPVQHPEIFDPYTTLSALRSGGMSLFADSRALTMRDTFERSKQQNADLEAGVVQHDPFCAEELTRGYRLDIWDSVTGEWHSLHRINRTLHIGGDRLEVTDDDTEGFFQAAMTKAAPDANGNRATSDLYLHESMARWTGWSLSASTVGVHLTRAGDPEKALPDPANPDPDNVPVTEFAIESTATHVVGTLPRLRFGVGYRLRLRRVDLADNGLTTDAAETGLITPEFSMPRGDGQLPYLRFEPVGSPVVVARDTGAVGGRGSSIDRLVIRTANTSPELDTAAADLTSSERHIAPPGVHVEQAERHGMLDGPDGRLVSSPQMWSLISTRDQGQFTQQPVPELVIDGEVQSIPVDASDQAVLPYLPDPLARAAAFRDLPGTSGRSRGRVTPDDPTAGEITYVPLDDPQPRAGTATIVEFGGRADWQQVAPFRLALADGSAAPQWDPAQRLLTVSLPKGSTHVVRLSSCPDPADLELLGVWSWLREYVRYVTVNSPNTEFYQDPDAKDRIAHVLQLAAEGGHGMLTPPRILTLVHAVQQPIGRPAFTRLTAQFGGRGAYLLGLQTEPETAPTAVTELAVASAWRELGSTDAYLVGALQVHAESTAKIDVVATWVDPVDDLVADPGEQQFTAAVDEIPLPVPREGLLTANGEDRDVGWYDAEHDLIAFAPNGARFGNLAGGAQLYDDAAPRHRIGDTRHHLVHYAAVATSRYREYFPPTDDASAFARASDPVEVHVPASARPLAPSVRYVVPTFGWERVGTGTQVRSVRTGGGLRVYLDRPWFSSGVGELLGVTLATPELWSTDREKLKPFVTQWGQDPIWASTGLDGFPDVDNFPDAVASESELPLGDHSPGPVAVAGHEVMWDAERKLWFCDLTVDTGTTTYSPFVRLALARYQPHALVAAKLSRVVLADFAQLTPERALTVTASPFEPGVLSVAVSGPAASGPVPLRNGQPVSPRPGVVTIVVQERDATLDSDLAWTTSASFQVSPTVTVVPDLVLWHGSVRWTGAGQPEPGRYRLLISEHEIYPVDPRPDVIYADTRIDPFTEVGSLLSRGPATSTRLVYAETVEIDADLLARPPYPAATTTLP